MDLFKKFRSAKTVITKDIEQKNAPSAETNNGYESLIKFLQDGDNYDLSFAVLLDYFERCSPFGDAVTMISDLIADIQPIVKNKKTGEVVPDHEILKLFNSPNADMSQIDFFRHLANMVLITGNPTLKIIGNVNKPPLALDVVSPVNVDLQPNRYGALHTIRIHSDFVNSTFNAELIAGRNRYRNETDNELWTMYGFNPYRGSRRFFGTPTAKPLYYQIEQYLTGGQHNYSLLKRGARPGGTFTTNTETPLTDAQFKRLQDQIDLYYVGANNAGRPLLMENTAYVENIVNNKDMDWETLSDNARTDIYKQFNIPLAKVKPSNQTYSNLETSQLGMYDDAVIPWINYILSQLGSALFYRYGGDWEKYELGIDETKIPALQVRQNANLKVKREAGIYQINELRAFDNSEPLDGGDVLMLPANIIPALTEDGTVQDGEPNTDDENEKALQSATDKDGNPKFTQDQINSILNR